MAGAALQLYRDFLLSFQGWRLEHKWVALTLMLMAAHKGEGGVVSTTLSELERLAGVGRQVIKTALANLEKDGFLTRIATRGGTLITITNFKRYNAASVSLNPRPPGEPNPQLDPSKVAKPRAPNGEQMTIPNPIHDKVIADFNETLGRNYKTFAWALQVDRLIAASYSVKDMRAVIWLASTWSENVRARCNPRSLFRLTSLQGGATFPQHLDMAQVRWRELYPDEHPPWMDDD